MAVGIRLADLFAQRIVAELRAVVQRVGDSAEATRRVVSVQRCVARLVGLADATAQFVVARAAGAAVCVVRGLRFQYD